jgi:integrase
MSIETRQTAKGERRYEVRLRDVVGREYSRTFRTRKEAERFENSERADRARGSWIDPRRASDRFADVAAEWLESDPRKKESSIARDESIIRMHLLPTLGDSPIGQLTPADVQRLVNHWAAELQPRTVRRQYAVLRAILTLAVDTDRIGRSPCRKIKLPAERPVDHLIITPEQLQAVAAGLDQSSRPMVYLGAVLGLRWGECAGLRVGDIDFLGRSLAVATQLTRGQHGRMVTGDPKWASQRRMAVPDPLLDLLALHLRSRQLRATDLDEPVCTSPDGEALHYTNWRQRQWLPACQKAGVRGLTFHALRAANATAMVALRVDIKTAQARAGHRTPMMTLNVYARPTEDGDRAAARQLGAYFLGATTDPAATRDARGMEPSGS